MSSPFYNNHLFQGGYKSWKGTGVFSNPVGVTSGNIRPLTNNDPTNSAPQKFGLPRPIQHYRKGTTVTSLDNIKNSRQVKSSTGGGSLVGQMIDIPGGFSMKENPSNEISNTNTEQLNIDCKTCQGIGIISDWKPITNLTEKPEPETQSVQYCCNQERNALRRIRSSNSKLKKNYYTTTTNYLYNRCQTFEQKQFNYLSSGTSTEKPGAPLSQNNVYKGNCNPNLEIQYTESQLLDVAYPLTPSNPINCETVQYKPNNYKYAQQGAVSSSDRMLRLNVDTINTNRADIIKTQENLAKSKYFPNASANIYKQPCLIAPRAIVSEGTLIMNITYNANYSPLKSVKNLNSNSRFLKVQSRDALSEELLPPAPIITSEYITFILSYKIIDLAKKEIEVSIKYQLFTNEDALLLTLGLSFSENVEYYNERIKIIDIKKFGGMPLFGLGYQFAGLTPEIHITAPDQPRIIAGTSALNAFNLCSKFNSPGILNWNIRNVVNLEGAFKDAITFNQTLSSWDTTNVTTMREMFSNATAFNNGQNAVPAPIMLSSTWDTEYEPDLDYEFESEKAFNTKQTMSSQSFYLDTTSVTDMAGMFSNATTFNQYIGDWNTSAVTDMSSMFESASAFNNGEDPGLSDFPLYWDTGNVTLMNNMFQLAISFNQSIGSWTTPNVTNMASMFQSSTLFNNGELGIQDIVGDVTPAYYTDTTATLTCPGASFTTEVELNDIIVISTSAGVVYSSQIKLISSDTTLVMLTPYGSNIGSAALPIITSIQKIPTHIGGTTPLYWDTGNVQNMKNMFQYALSFNQYIGDWNTPNVTDMDSMFTFASSFNNGSAAGLSDDSLNGWNTGNVTLMNNMFQNASAFNQPIGNWDTHSVTNMGFMFKTTQFNQPLTTSGNSWNTGLVESMTYMFHTTSAFNQDISSWNTSSVRNFSYMFYKALAFNNGDSGNNGLNPLSWNTLNATTTRTMFYGAPNFNQDVSSWTVSNVTTMTNMFGLATKFNNGNPLNTDAKSLSNWKASKCTSFSGMFNSAIAFNQNVSNLVDTLTLADPSGCDLSSMFSSATLFNNGITTNIDTAPLTWKTKNVTNMTYTFNSASSFNQYIGDWDTARVADMTFMFQNATLFDNGETGTVDISGNPYTGAFYLNSTRVLTSPNSKFIRDVSSNDVLIITYGPLTSPTIIYTSKIQSISSDVSLVLLTAYGSDISSNTITSIKKQVVGTQPMSWNTTSLPDMQYMFSNATYFNQRVDNFTVGNATHMFSSTVSPSLRGIFNNGQLAGSNDNSLRNWNTVASGSIGAMFLNSAGFNQNISNWNVSNVGYTGQMFQGTQVYNNGLAPSLFNNDSSLNSWNTSSFADIQVMFNGAIAFNQNISNWDVSKVTTMNGTFSGATLFNNGDTTGSSNQPLTNWYAPKSRDFERMFISAVSFNQAIPILVDTSGIILDASGNGVTMNSMFQSASSFNKNLNTWNTSKVSIMSSVFSGASAFNNGETTNTGSNPLNWITDNVTTMSQMFVNASVFNQPINTSGIYWNTGKVTTMFQMLARAFLFNQPISGWNTGNVTNMGQMFYFATAFNQNISAWTVSNVITMFQMFGNTTAFNNGAIGNINNNPLTWSAPNCSNFTSMFQSAIAFNQNVSNLVNTSGLQDCSLNNMFLGALLFNNGQTGTTDISGTLVTTGAFYTNSTKLLTCVGANFTTLTSNDVLIITTGTITSPVIIYTSKIQTTPISDVSLVLLTPYGLDILAPNITSIKKQVAGTADLSWNTTNVTTMASIFNNAYYFNQRLPSWSVSKVTSMALMFAGSSTALKTVFNNGQLAGSNTQPLNWYAPLSTSFINMFLNNAGFNQTITTLVDSSGATPAVSLGGMFQAASVFNQDISGWNVSNVTDMTNVFRSTTIFNQNLNGWNVGNVTNMTNMFQSAVAYNNGGVALTWYAPKCTNFTSMFQTTSAFNQPISTLVDTSGILVGTPVLLTSMFQSAALFNQNLNGWNVSKVTIMSSLFQSTPAFNNGGAAGTSALTWYAPKCTLFNSMFATASVFNQAMPNLVDTSGVTVGTTVSLDSMFISTPQFNQSINTWDVSNVTLMSNMFRGALLFNQPIGTWKTGSVTTMSNMFNGAPVFNQNIGSWNTGSVISMDNMFINAREFNNGQLKPSDISGTVTSGTYTNLTATLSVPLAQFTTDLSVNNVLIITTSTIIYTSQIQRIISNTSLVLLTLYGADILTGITSIKKQVVGAADLSWNTANVTTMANMFNNAYYFNQNISNWSTSKVTTMASMFAGPTTLLKTTFNNGQLAGSFGQQLNWTASRCTTFASMFAFNAGFNQPVPTLVDVSCTTLTSMFSTTSAFNRNISTWNTSNVTAMDSMFINASVFNNGQIGTLDVSGTLATASYTATSSILSYPGAAFITDLSLTDVLIITSGTTIIYTSQIQRIISDASLVLLTPGPVIAVGAIRTIKKQLAGNSTFDLSWNTANVTNMTSMFQNAFYFNQNISNWSVSKVINMTTMFAGATTSLKTIFNNGQLAGSGDVSLNWTASRCTIFTSMFANTSGFNQAVSTLVDVSGSALTNMFNAASVFNRNVSTWNTSNVTTLSGVFQGAGVFNNGQSVTQTVRGTPSLASYSNTTFILTCPDASFNLDFSLNDGIIITTGGSAIYSSIVATIPTNATLTLSAPYQISILLAAGVITSIKKQVVGSQQLTWNTQNVTTVASIFNGATYFNQQLPWNTRKIGTGGMTTAFIGAASFINLFNNGQIITGTTQPLSTGLGTTWDFSGNAVTIVAGGAWRANCRLTAQNGVTVNPAIY